MTELSSGEWEVNVKGMTGVLRLVRHHTDFVIVEYKDVVQSVMKHVKNLRSQVKRQKTVSFKILGGCTEIIRYPNFSNKVLY